MTDSITKGIHYLHSLHPFIPSSIAVRSTLVPHLCCSMCRSVSHPPLPIFIYHYWWAQRLRPILVVVLRTHTIIICLWLYFIKGITLSSLSSPSHTSYPFPPSTH